MTIARRLPCQGHAGLVAISPSEVPAALASPPSPVEDLVLHRSAGPLRYSHAGEGGFRLVVEVDPEIVRYYRSLLRRHTHTHRPRHAPHISAVRKETPPSPQRWGRHEGEVVEFHYTHAIFTNATYYWLNAYCPRLEEVRRELGLPVARRLASPEEGFEGLFHLTIGHRKAI